MTEGLKIFARDNHNKKREISEVVGITRDGWVITKDGAFGDVHEDCEIEIEMKSFIKDFRKKNDLTQQEVAWMLGISRPTFITLEQGGRELTLKEFLMLASFIPDNAFEKLRKNLLANENPAN